MNKKIIINLCQYIDFSSLIKLSLLCKKWNEIILYDKNIFENHFKNYVKTISQTEYNITGSTFRQTTSFDLMMDCMNEEKVENIPFSKKNPVHLLLSTYKLHTTTEGLCSQLIRQYDKTKNETFIKILMLLLENYYPPNGNVVVEGLLLRYEMKLVAIGDELTDMEMKLIQNRPKRKEKKKLSERKAKKNILDYEAKEIAKQMSHHDFELLKKVGVRNKIKKVVELVVINSISNMEMSIKKKSREVENLIHCIHDFNSLSKWTSDVFFKSDFKEKIIIFLIEILKVRVIIK
jgi:hypothetical protein